MRFRVSAGGLAIPAPTLFSRSVGGRETFGRCLGPKSWECARDRFPLTAQ